jgi:membrane associated rhomboid family serine protease
LIFASSSSYFVKDANPVSLAPLTDKRIILVSLMWLLINALMGSGFLPIPGQGTAGIAWEAHIGGYLAGLLLIPIFDRWAGGQARNYRSSGP